MGELVERSLPIPDVRGSIQSSAYFILPTYILSTVFKRRK